MVPPHITVGTKITVATLDCLYVGKQNLIKFVETLIGYSANINIMIAAAKATKSILRDFGELEKLQVSVKGQNDFVTVADVKLKI